MTFRFEKPIIYLITKGEATDSNFVESSRAILDIVRVAVEEKVTLIQIREKKLSGRCVFELTSAVVRVTRGSKTRVIVNDRADIALGAGADGVHLTANSLPVDVIRKSFPDNFIIGVSTHSSDEVVNSARSGADLAVFGPVFATPGKESLQGLTALHDVCALAQPFPVIGIGGIDRSNFQAVLDAGAAGIAAIRSLNDPASLRGFRKLFD